MATLSIINNLEMTSQGTTTVAKQGAAADAFATPHTLTVNGTEVTRKGTLATGGSVTLYDDDSDQPQDWQYCHITTDRAGYVQLIGAATHVVLPLVANVPFTLAGDSLLAAASTTAITTSEPSLTDIDSVLIGNWSGSTMSYRAVFIN